MQAVTVMLYFESGISPLTFDEFSKANISRPEEGVKVTPPNPMRFTEQLETVKFSLQVFAGYRMQANNRSVHWSYTPHISRVMTYSSQTTTCKYLHKIASWGPCSKFSSEDIYVLAYLKGNCNGNIFVHYLHSINGERSACAADIRSWGVEFNIIGTNWIIISLSSTLHSITLMQ